MSKQRRVPKAAQCKETIEAMVAGLVKAANRLSLDSTALRDENLVLRAQLRHERSKNAGVVNELIKSTR